MGLTAAVIYLGPWYLSKDIYLPGQASYTTSRSAGYPWQDTMLMH